MGFRWALSAKTTSVTGAMIHGLIHRLRGVGFMLMSPVLTDPLYRTGRDDNRPEVAPRTMGPIRAKTQRELVVQSLIRHPGARRRSR
ncbi:MAG: hypothetical protein JWO02_830 [Solirubrobacterales bacterium]|nr:hypothetical protein [Solirubrobacterales bacterium]